MIRVLALSLIVLAACKPEERRLKGPTNRQNLVPRLGECLA